MFSIQAVQEALVEAGLDGWLLYDFRGSNLLARRVLGIPNDRFHSRRWYYWIPARGEPRKLVHQIEQSALEGLGLPGAGTVYLRWQELEAGVAGLVKGSRRIAMEYSPRNGNPYVSRVDGGTLELVRSLGVEVLSSGDLIQRFEARWDAEQWDLHLRATRVTRSAFDHAFAAMAKAVRSRGEVTETEIQNEIMAFFKQHGVTCDHPPIVGVGPHSGDPHYSPDAKNPGIIREGDFVLVDLWAKVDHPKGVYSDLTRTCFIGNTVPPVYSAIFDVVARARDAAIERVRSAFSRGEKLMGYQVDDACREVIEAAGMGRYFCHRTGHSIGRETHGNGANMDNLETHETRLVMPATCFSVEPGIYQDAFGVRSEVNVFVHPDGRVEVTGDPQTEITPVLRDF